MTLAERPQDLVASLAVFLAVLAPPGLLLLRWARAADTERELGAALALGYTTLLPLLVLERALGLPVVAPVALVCALALFRRPPQLSVRGLLRAAPLPLALGALAACANAGDASATAGGGLAFRVGFDVSDRAIYTLIAQELHRALPPLFENPLFAGEHPSYSFFPSLLGLLVDRYSHAGLVSMFGRHLPVLAFVMIGVGVDGLLAATGVASRRDRALTALLLVLGGDLSWLLAAPELPGPERTSRFLAFHSFSAESLYYNPWMLGLPLAVAGLQLALLWMRSGDRRQLVLAGLVLGGLWETKVFACIALLLGALGAGLLLRQGRLLALALASSLGALPWVLVTTLSRGAGGGAPLVLDALLPIRFALDVLPALGPLASRIAGMGSFAAWIALAALVPPYVAASFGVRLVGVSRLGRLVHGHDSGFHRFVLVTLVVSLTLGLLVAGRPVATDGAQFLTLPLLLGWMYAGPALAEMLRGPRWARVLACALLLAAVVNPVRYLALKRLPQALTAQGSADRLSIEIPPHVLSACAWIRATTGLRDTLLVPLRGDNMGGLKPLYVAVLAERRLAAYVVDFLVTPEIGRARRDEVNAVYSTPDAAAAEGALARLGTRWVWEERANPLRFASARLLLRFDSPAVRIYEFEPGR